MAGRDDLLERYREMRDFRETPEPRGKRARKTGHSFVIQKHAARRLHYDLRLEVDGVLKSWAVTRGPSLDPADKRLAVRTEDHPLEYREFEGVIPSGYGAGTMMIWDRGEWEPDGDPHEGLESGHLRFTLKGERLKGGFSLIRMKGKKEKRENWLLVKRKDAAADSDADPLERWTQSVVSNRGLDAIANRKPAAQARETSVKLSFVEPQLAKLEDAPPEGEAWVHEVKYDGYRIQALVSGGRVRLITRNGKDWTERYPAIATALSALKADSAILDGELVALDAQGRSRFGALQTAGQNGGAGGEVELDYFVFDLLHLDGEDRRGAPLTERKAALAALLDNAPPTVRYSDHIEGRGARVIEKACAMGLEGIISKRVDAPYNSGRGRDWIKSKCIGNDEFVIGGYRKSDKASRPFASLLLGEFENGKLLYRGRVGTGFDDAMMADLAARMKPLERAKPAFHDLPTAAKRGAVWLKPALVGQINYTERTGSGALRHPSFLGLREDKPAESVVTPSEKGETMNTKAGGTGKTDSQKRDDDAPVVAGIRLSSPDRIVYPDQGLTKLQLAEYLDAHADRILEHLAGRPVSLVRCPQGRAKACFFQKNHTDAMPDAIGRVQVRTSGGMADYMTISDRRGLVAAAQFGALEFHIWGSRNDRLERPDRLVFDLDPDEGLDFSRVKTAAQDVHGVLDAMGLESFAMLTGGKGVHVVCPLERRRDWPDVKAFAKGLALKLAGADPDRYVATASKAKRKGKIFIDWLRNERGATAIAPFSPRARSGAPVATPIGWDELSRIKSGAAYAVDTIGRRLGRLKSDPWAGYGEVRQSITASHLEAIRGDADTD